MLKVDIKSFTLKELSCRCCGAFNINNDFLIALQAFRNKFNQPITVTCACRCKKHNAEVGGEPTSLHECSTKRAGAADCYNKDLKKLYNDACICGLFNEVIWYNGYKGMNFVHIGIDLNQKGSYFDIKK